MSCFNHPSTSNIYEPCCNGNTLCHFDGNLNDVYSVPVYVQRIYDAVQFNMQGMKTMQSQAFTPALPSGATISRVADIRARAYFNPANIDDPRNLTVDMDTSLTGATFLRNSQGNIVEVIGPDGTYSQKILYPDNTCCDEDGKGTPIFGTQNVTITGNVVVYLDLILCNYCNHETCYTVSAEIPIATATNPMTLTNFFEVCMPAGTEYAYLPRFTEITSMACEARLATNNCCRDLIIGADGQVIGNLLVALCVNAQKQVVAPSEMCVLTTGMTEVPAQTNSLCNGFPNMFADGINKTNEHCSCDPGYIMPRFDNCGCNHHEHHEHHNHHEHHDNYGCIDDCGCNDNCGCNDHFPPQNCR